MSSTRPDDYLQHKIDRFIKLVGGLSFSSPVWDIVMDIVGPEYGDLVDGINGRGDAPPEWTELVRTARDAKLASRGLTLPVDLSDDEQAELLLDVEEPYCWVWCYDGTGVWGWHAFFR